MFHSKIHTQDVKSVDFDGINMISTGYDNSVVFYKQIDGDFEVVNAINSAVGPESIGELDFVQNNTIYSGKLLGQGRAVTCGADGCIRLYNQCEQVGCYSLSKCAIYDISVDREDFICCGEDGVIYYLKVDDNIEFKIKMELQKGELNSCEIVDRVIYVGGDDGCVRVFQLE